MGRCAKLGEVMVSFERRVETGSEKEKRQLNRFAFVLRLLRFQEFVSLRSAAIEAPPPLAVIRSLTLVRPTSNPSRLLLLSPSLKTRTHSSIILHLISIFLFLSSQSTIYSPSSNLILHVYPLPWLVQTYLEETALVPAGLLHSVVDLAQDDFPRPWGRQNEGGTGKEGPTLGEAVGVFEQRVSGVSPPFSLCSC